MSNVFKIFKKEMDKVFRFPRTIFATLILPGMMIFLIYAFIGQSLESQIDRSAEYVGIVHVIDAPASFDFAITNQAAYKIEFSASEFADLESLTKEVEAGTIDAVLMFETDFDSKVGLGEDPAIDIYYDSSKTNSGIVYAKIQALISVQRDNFLEDLSIDPNIFAISDHLVSDESKSSAKILSMILPMIILSFLFGSALGIGSDAIAGEKERGTLATLLMAPISRNHIIIGKIMSTAVLTIFSAFSSFIGILASLPFAKSMFAVEGELGYGALEYLGILLLLLVLSVLISSILLITSTIAKTVKEATMYAMPIYMASILMPVMTMFSEGTSASSWMYLIPIYNCTLGLKGILAMDISLLNYSLVIGSTMVFAALIIWGLIRLFRSEKVLFSK